MFKNLFVAVQSAKLFPDSKTFADAVPKSAPAEILSRFDAAKPVSREALQALLRSVGLRVSAFSSPAEFLTSRPPDMPSCLILDVRLPGVSGLEFQTELSTAKFQIPIIFMTAFPEEKVKLRVLSAGAHGFLTKPCEPERLINCIATALAS